MAEWIETYRGSVMPWECDTTEHFTIAYYLDRVEQGSIEIADRLGLADTPHLGALPRRFGLRFIRELRAGASFHIESGALGIEPDLCLGHRFVASASGEIVTWVKETWEANSASPRQRVAIGPMLASWDGPEIERRPDPGSLAGAIVTARGRVRPSDLDEFERFSLAAFVHRFTDALIQITAAIGITAEYMQRDRRGYSTFELDLRISRTPKLGEPLIVETGVAHLGSSSVRFLHRMSDPRDGSEFARLGQFGVQLDLDARRPAPLPEPMRTAAARLLLPAG